MIFEIFRNYAFSSSLFHIFGANADNLTIIVHSLAIHVYIISGKFYQHLSNSFRVLVFEVLNVIVAGDHKKQKNTKSLHHIFESNAGNLTIVVHSLAFTEIGI